MIFTPGRVRLILCIYRADSAIFLFRAATTSFRLRGSSPADGLKASPGLMLQTLVVIIIDIQPAGLHRRVASSPSCAVRRVPVSPSNRPSAAGRRMHHQRSRPALRGGPGEPRGIIIHTRLRTGRSSPPSQPDCHPHRQIILAESTIVQLAAASRDPASQLSMSGRSRLSCDR